MNPYAEAGMWDAIVFVLKATVVVSAGITAGATVLLIGSAWREWRVRRRTMDMLICSLEARGHVLLQRERAAAEFYRREGQA